jgi:hypothetical protein
MNSFANLQHQHQHKKTREINLENQTPPHSQKEVWKDTAQ